MSCKSLVPLLTRFAVIVGIFLCVEIKRKQCEFGILYELNLIFVINIGHVHLVHLIMLSQLLDQMYNVQFLLQLLPSHRKDSFILCLMKAIMEELSATPESTCINLLSSIFVRERISPSTAIRLLSSEEVLNEPIVEGVDCTHCE